jgi:outer membrane murein-binding lipoprotein Lpp
MMSVRCDDRIDISPGKTVASTTRRATTGCDQLVLNNAPYTSTSYNGNDALLERLDARLKKCRELQQEYEGIRPALAISRERVRGFEGEVNALASEVKELRRQNIELRRQRDAAAAYATKAFKDLEATSESASRMEERATAKINLLASQVADLRGQVRALEHQIAERPEQRVAQARGEQLNFSATVSSDVGLPAASGTDEDRTLPSGHCQLSSGSRSLPATDKRPEAPQVEHQDFEEGGLGYFLVPLAVPLGLLFAYFGHIAVTDNHVDGAARIWGIVGWTCCLTFFAWLCGGASGQSGHDTVALGLAALAGVFTTLIFASISYTTIVIVAVQWFGFAAGFVFGREF